jgi:hypothetical protein
MVQWTQLENLVNTSHEENETENDPGEEDRPISMLAASGHKQ